MLRIAALLKFGWVKDLRAIGRQASVAITYALLIEVRLERREDTDTPSLQADQSLIAMVK
jgi:hypothetical protein